MKDKELLIEAIDSYSLLPKAGRTILKMLINLEIDDIIIISIKELSELSSISRPAVYSSLKILEDNGLIERQVKPGSRLSSFILKPQKFSYILQHYNIRKNIKPKKTLHN